MTGASFNDGSSKKNRSRTSDCSTCDLYQLYMKKLEKDAKKSGLEGSVQHPQFSTPQGKLMQDVFYEPKCQTFKGPNHALEGVIQELGELPIIKLHKLQQKREDSSGKFYPEDRGLAEVCNPIGGSYMTARPFRCQPTYRFCEPMNGSYAGHVPGEQFVIGLHRGKATRNATKYMTYRV